MSGNPVVPASGVPPSWRRVEAYRRGNRVIVMGHPDENDETHNCDAMGCGSCHVVAILDIPERTP